MHVQQLMTQQVHCCSPADTLEQIARSMWNNDCGALPVCSSNGVTRVVGMITDRDIAMCALFQGKPLHELHVSEAMAQDVRTCNPTDSLADVERIMREGKIRRLPVIDDEGGVVGMISLADLAQEAMRERNTRTKEITDGEVSDTLAAICMPAVRGIAFGERIATT